MTATWMQVMTFVRRLDEQRQRGEPILATDSERLVSMLLEFHRQTIARTPSGEMEAVHPPGSSPQPPQP